MQKERNSSKDIFPSPLMLYDKLLLPDLWLLGEVLTEKLLVSLDQLEFEGHGQDLVYHRAEGILSHVTILVGIVVKEGLKDVPEELCVLWGPSLNSLGDESLELVLGTSVEDGVRIKGGDLG